MGSHGWTGVSPVSRHATLTGVRSVNDPSATNVAQVVLHGVHRDTPEGLLLMPAFGQAYTDREIAAVANYVTARFGAEGAALTEKDVAALRAQAGHRSEEHTSELQSLMRISYAVFCLKKKKYQHKTPTDTTTVNKNTNSEILGNAHIK